MSFESLVMASALVQVILVKVILISCFMQAEETMARSLGRPSNAVFDRLSREPVAAASLGQVYRGRLRPELGGHEVAVKVQRPGVLKAVALDLYLMRRLAVQLDKYVSLFCTLIPSQNGPK